MNISINNFFIINNNVVFVEFIIQMKIKIIHIWCFESLFFDDIDDKFLWQIDDYWLIVFEKLKINRVIEFQRIDS